MKTAFTPSANRHAEIAKCRAMVMQPVKNERQGLPAKTWAEMPIRTRAVLVMLGGTTVADPREVARRPWEALSIPDRESIAALAREMRDNLKNASCLF